MTGSVLRRLTSFAARLGKPSRWPRPNSLTAWAIAAALVLAGFVAKPLLDGVLGIRLPQFITFYASVTISALLGGPRIGLAVTFATGLLNWYFFMAPYAPFGAASLRTVTALAVYLAISAFLAWIVGTSRLAQDALSESEARRDRAARESVHRIKNLIAVVQAISSKLAREVTSVPEYKAVLSARLVALGSAQDVLVQSGWTDVGLADLVRAALAPFLPNPGFDVRYGPGVKVPARHVGGLSMALYELCTNSMKYGALAEGQGPVTLAWREERGTVVLEWRERTPNLAKRDEGLGTQLIRYALGNDTACHVRYDVDGPDITALFCWPRPR